MFETNDTKLCRGCLSADRKLTSVSTGDLMMYYSLLAENQKLDALSIPGIDLCWECVAMLHRTQKFRARVQRAHTILEDSLGLPPGKTTLSSLTIQHKLEYDAILEETKSNDQPLFCKPVVPDTTVDKIVIPTKYKAVVTENDVENAKAFKDVINDNLANTNDKNDIKIEIENMSDDSDYEKFDASDRRSCSPEITIKKRTPRKNIQDVKILPFSNLKDVKSKSKAKAQYKPIVKRVPIVKTPVIVKLELELQTLMQNAKYVTATEMSKQKNTKKESTENARSNDTAKLIDVIGKGSSEEDASNHDRKESKTKCKRNKPESDPDFSLDEDEDSASNHSKIEDENDGEKEKIKKQKRYYKKIITRYKHIAEVLSCFTKIEISADDFKKTLEKDVDEKKPYHCSICGYRFRVARLLTNHAARLHKGTHPGQFRKGSFYNPPPTIPESPCLWRCNICTKMLRIEHIIAHMNENHRTQYFCNGDGCEWSLKGFWMKEDHAEHWAAIHKQFSCYRCGARKKSKSSMESHILEVHLQVPKQQCPHCTRTYVRRRTLLQHIQNRHSAPEPAERRYCVECDVTFSSVARLQSHFNVKHNEARIKYPCEQCDRVLANRTTYQNHYNLFHTGKTEHCCHICGKYLSKSQALENHLKSHLNIKVPKKIPCTICGRKFQNNRSLNHHIYTHTGERPYQCTRCEAAYTQPYCLRVHLLKRHGVRESVPCVPVKRSTRTQDQQ